MAKLSTLSHPCVTQFVSADGVPTRKCGGDAYRRIPKGHPRAGQWECPRCRHTRERGERSRQAAPAFQVIGRLS